MKSNNFIFSFDINSLSIFTQIKLYFIILMVFVFLFLIFIEIESKYSPNKKEYLASGFSIHKNIVKFMGIIGAASSFGSFLINKNKKDLTELSNNLKKDADRLNQEIIDLKESQLDIKTSVLA